MQSMPRHVVFRQKFGQCRREKQKTVLRRRPPSHITNTLGFNNVSVYCLSEVDEQLSTAAED